MDEFDEVLTTLEHGDLEPELFSFGEGARRSLATRALRGFLWSMVSLAGSRLLVFTSTIALTWILVPAQFGVVAAAMTVTLFLEAANDLGLASAIIYEQEEGTTGRVQIAFTLNVLVSAVLTAVMVAAAPLLADFFHVPDQVNVFRVLAFYLLIRGFMGVPDAIMQRDLRFRRRTITALSAAAIRSVLAVVLAVAGYGSWSIVIGLLVGQIVGGLIGYAMLRFVPRFRFERTAAREMLRFGLPMMGMAFLSLLLTNVDYLIVGHRLGDQDLGLYQIGFRVPELVLGGVYLVFSSVAFPTYSNARVQGLSTLRESMLRALGFLSLFGFTVGIGLALVARDVVGLVVGPEFAAAAAPMALISLTAGVSAVNFASGDIFPAVGRPGILLRLNLVNLAMIVTALMIASNYGIVWVAFVSLPVHAIYSLCRVLFANRFVASNVRENLHAIRPAIWASVGIAVLAVPVRMLMPTGLVSLVAITVAGVVGAVLALLIGAPATFGDVASLVRRVRG